MPGHANPTLPTDLPIDPFDPDGPAEPSGPTESSNSDNPVNAVIDTEGVPLTDLVGPGFGEEVAEAAMSGAHSPALPDTLPIDPVDPRGPAEPLGPAGSSNPDNPVNAVINTEGGPLTDLIGPGWGEKVAEAAMSGAPTPGLPDNLPVDPFDPEGPAEPLGPTGSSNPDNPVNEVVNTEGGPLTDLVGPGFGEQIAEAAIPDDLPLSC